MKKVLLATTLLVAGAAGASAEVTLSGDARMGIVNTLASNDTTFTSRARVKFTLSGESDSGLSFGASFRAADAVGAGAGTNGDVFVSGAFGKLSMGDVDGAAQSAVGNVDGVGLTGLGDLNESVFVGAGGLSSDAFANFGVAIVPKVNVTSDPTALYEYSAGAFSAYASVTKPNYTFSTALSTFEGIAYAVGGKYSLDNYSFALGYEKLSIDFLGGANALDFKHVIASASGTFGGVTVKATYGKGSGNNGPASLDLKQYALSGTYGTGALKATAFVSGKTFEAAGATTAKLESVGLGASYDLGGGASVVGGLARTKDTVAGTRQSAFDLGLSFSF